VSHLGDQLSALIDGELNGTELDRANAHLAACATCRAEAGSLRRLKHELHALAEVCDADGLTRRLLAMPHAADGAGPDVPEPAENLRPAPGGRRHYGPSRPVGHRGPGGPYDGLSRRPAGRRRGRTVLWSTVSLVVVGVGTAAFTVGGGSGASGPQITPQLEVFDLQHAVTSGDVPFADPVDGPSRIPAMTARP
jgi:anti-sigma factor RsiW